MKILVTDRIGDTRIVESGTATVLMHALRDLPNGVLAICGGMAACGTCHVYVSEECRDRLPPVQPDERVILDGLSHSTSASRLSCQMRVSTSLEGLRVTLAPEE